MSDITLSNKALKILGEASEDFFADEAPVLMGQTDDVVPNESEDYIGFNIRASFGIVSSTAIILFGKMAKERRSIYKGIQAKLRQAHISKSIEVYVSLVYFYSFIMTIIGGALGIVLYSLISPSTSLLVFLLWELGFTVAAGFLTRNFFFWYPSFRASVRRTGIDGSLPYAVAYMHAMSKGGMNIIEIFKSLSKHSHIFMDAAEEVEYIVRDMTLFGMDIMSALYLASERTPSAKFKDFIDNLITVVDSGGDITSYFASTSERYQNEAIDDQKSYLETLGMVAESYITAFVAGPLFLITILVVMGIAGSGSSLMVEMIIYLMVPVGSIVFIILLNVISISDQKKPEFYTTIKELNEYDDISCYEADSGEESIFYDELERAEKRIKIEKIFKDPFRYFLEKPINILAISIPASLLYMATVISRLDFRLPAVHGAMIQETDPLLIVEMIDGPLVIMLLLVLAPFTLFYEIQARKVKKIESEIPNFLNRLSSTNESGITLSKAIGMLVESNLGVLDSEIRKVWKDISWGRDTNESLVKLEKRIKTPSISRTITLITRASEATGNIKDVLKIAAKDSEISERLKKERSMDMSSYMVLIYISFLVFLVIIYVLSSSFLSIVPEASTTPQEMNSISSGVDIEKYNRIFFHAAAIQGFFSGLIAGEMGEGNGKAGIKHSLIMVTIAYVVFTYVIG
ncbi:MAG: type II secretion system F family protein [Halobacteriota archaeon]|nr:type II secretion system F family protein [Halobacteriota archaeon]